MKDVSPDLSFDALYDAPRAPPAATGTRFGARQRRLLACALALCASLWILFFTREPNPAIGPDSVSYLAAAESLAHGHGLRVPFADWSDATSSARLRHFPPGFPALIAIPTALGMQPIQAARLIEALAGGVTAALLVFAASASVAGWAGAAAGALAATMAFATPGISRAHGVVLSEPLFLLTCVLLAIAMQRSPSRPLALGCIAAVGAMVRYVGVALAPAVVLWMLLQPGSLRRRLVGATVAGLPSVFAIVCWQHWTGHFRHYGYQPGIAETASELWPTLAAWLVPAFKASALRGALAFALLVSIALVWHAAASARAPSDPARVGFDRLRRASLLVSTCYAAVVLGSRLYADPDIPFDWRLLAPIILLAELTFAVALVRALPSSGFASRAAATLLLGLWLAGSGYVVGKEAIDTHAHAWGYGSSDWQASALARWLRAHARGYALYTDNPAAVWQIARRQSRILPASDDAATSAEFARAIEHRRVAVLGFAGPLVTTVAPEKLAQQLALSSGPRFPQASIWLSSR